MLFFSLLVGSFRRSYCVVVNNMLRGLDLVAIFFSWCSPVVRAAPLLSQSELVDSGELSSILEEDAISFKATTQQAAGVAALQKREVRATSRKQASDAERERERAAERERASAHDEGSGHEDEDDHEPDQGYPDTQADDSAGNDGPCSHHGTVEKDLTRVMCDFHDIGGADSIFGRRDDHSK